MSSAAVRRSMVVLYVTMAAACLQVVGGAPSPPATVEAMDDYADVIERQARELKSLGCQPVLQKVVLADVLKIHDALSDKMYFPQVVAVRRCEEECSFCGDQDLGRTKGRCLPDPTNVKERRVIVFYYEGGQRHYRRVLLDEHTSCKCS